MNTPEHKEKLPLDIRADSSLQALFKRANAIILGKPRIIKLCLACLLSRGHLLIEDLPGMGKTTLAHMLARSMGLEYQRIQFTSDLLPADLLGVSVYDRVSESFHFHPGPIFAQLVLADEINRATPKTQSALLEAMEERQVTIEGETRPLPQPFFVIATQNPLHQVGTFPLPESQLDRFTMRLSLGYPSPRMERLLLAGQGGRHRLAKLQPIITPEHLQAWQNATRRVHAADALLDYVQALLAASRQLNETPGLSPRAGLALLDAARAWAWLHGRDMLLPEDIQAVWVPVTAHRLQGSDHLAQDLLSRVPIP